MGKKTIIAIAICAVVAIAGTAGVAAFMKLGLPKIQEMLDKGEEITTTAPSAEDDNYVYETYYQDVFEPVTNAENETVTTPDGSLLTTHQQIVQSTKKPANKVTTTKKPTPAKNTTTTKKSDTGTVSYPGDDKIVDKVIGPYGNQFLGYRYEPNGDYYYTDDKDCWQANCGYNEIYDNMAAFIMMNIDQVRIRFTYENQDWMIQLWKGQYGNLLIGAEIGVYTAPSGTYTGQVGDVNHYNCADKEDWLKMYMTCYWRENNQGSYKKAFEREYDYYWWATGFVKGQLTKYTAPRTELKLKSRITFKSTQMANLFVEGMKQSGFARALGSDQLVDDSYYQKDADVWFLWKTKYHDCFVGYEGRN